VAESGAIVVGFADRKRGRGKRKALHQQGDSGADRLHARAKAQKAKRLTRLLNQVKINLLC
jgi:hypothetical protein